MTVLPLRRTLVLALAATWLLCTASPPVGAQADEPTRGRLLVFAVPGVTWADLRGRDLPAFERLLGLAATLQPASYQMLISWT